jgi:hypothetical protein
MVVVFIGKRNSNGKEQMANVQQFELCHLPFAL